MVKRVRGSRTGRPIMVLLDLLGRRWALRIVWELREEPRNQRAHAARAGRPASFDGERDSLPAGMDRARHERGRQRAGRARRGPGPPDRATEGHPMKALAAVLAVLAGYVLGRRHGRLWECRDRLVDAIEEAAEAGVVEIEPPSGWGPCVFCFRTFLTKASALRHHELVSMGIRCESA